MRELNWQITKFNHIHTYPADLPQGAEAYAHDMVNLRVNRWGHLRPRPPIRALPTTPAPDGVTITGVAASGEDLYYLRSDGKLFIENYVTQALTEITDVANLVGQLSLVGTFDDFVIFTSEGTDGGYFLYTSENRRRVDAFHIETPEVSDATDFIIQIGAHAQNNSDALTDDYYFYKFTYSIENGEAANESEPTERVATQIRKFPDPHSPSARLGPIGPPTDHRVKMLHIYRSSQRWRYDIDDDRVTYYEVGRREIKVGDTPIIFPAPRDLPDRKVILQDNSSLPINASQLAYYNGRLFTPNGNELRYSDVQDGIPYWRLWPVINSLRVEGQITFCAEYQGYLLFGGRDGLYSLIGDSKYNFRINRISARGPTSPHAWGILSNVFGFIAVDGFYLTDGVNVQEFGGPLKGYFNRYTIDAGVVAQLPNRVSLWGLTRRNTAGNTDTLHFINEQGNWMRLDTDPIHQTASVALNDKPPITIVADNAPVPRIFNWIIHDEIPVNTTEPINWAWESQQLDWNAQGLGERIKNFKWLEISGLADPPAITVTFYIDDKDPIVVETNLNREITNRFRPLRVRINRWGYALRFTIEGAGDITLRGLKLVIHT